jgi:hypothetical protein
MFRRFLLRKLEQAEKSINPLGDFLSKTYKSLIVTGEADILRRCKKDSAS